jgi:acetyl esterase/lipase
MRRHIYSPKVQVLRRLPILALIADAALLFLSIWIVVPAPNLALIVFGVAAPELSPLLLLTSIAFLGLTLLVAKGRLGKAAMSVATINIILCALPLTRFAFAVPHFDEAMGRLASDSRSHDRMRSRPLIVGELVHGIDTGESRVVRGIETIKPLTSTIYRPVSKGTFPILVQIYGGAWQRGSPDDNEIFARYFASRGHVVFAIDYRHAPRWRWPAQIEDVRAALAWIRAHASDYDGDATRIALVGRSSGAQLALVAAYQEGAAKVAGVVSFYGPTDLAEGWRVPPRPDPLGVRAVLETLLDGTPDQVPARYREASPITYVSPKVPPTLLIYGIRDHIVEAKFGRELDERLRSAGARSVLLEIPWAEHAFDVLASGLGGQVSLYYTERFLAAILSGEHRAP